MDFVLIVLICCSFNHTDILYAHRFFTIIIYEFIFFLCCRLYTALKFSWLSTYSDLFCSVLVYLTSPHVVRASISSRFAISLLSIHSRRSISITSQLFHPPFRINWYMNTLKFWLFSLIHLVLWLHRRLTKFVVPHVSISVKSCTRSQKYTLRSLLSVRHYIELYDSSFISFINLLKC
jgi:hypothetical protein